MADLPIGSVTFLFTDVEGSARLWERVPQPMRSAMHRHDLPFLQAVESSGGIVVKTLGP